MKLTTHTVILGEVEEEVVVGPLKTMPAVILHDSKHEYLLPPIRYPDGKW